MKQKLQQKFASENHAGPKDVADFMDLMDEDEIEMIKEMHMSKIMPCQVRFDDFLCGFVEIWDFEIENLNNKKIGILIV